MAARSADALAGRSPRRPNPFRDVLWLPARAWNDVDRFDPTLSVRERGETRIGRNRNAMPAIFPKVHEEAALARLRKPIKPLRRFERFDPHAPIRRPLQIQNADAAQ